MKKMIRRIAVCAFLVAIIWSISLITDRKKLNDGLIRFHVVANSDSLIDQQIKLTVRDVVIRSLEPELKNLTDIVKAREYLQMNLPTLELLVNQTLQDLGFDGGSRITLCKERFDIRHYDTFSLPAGVYDSLRIVIGEGLGKNWWCVSFPTLCIPDTTTGFSTVAVSAGFSKPLVNTLAGNEDYEIRFFLLDGLGRLDKIFFRG